MTVEGAFVEVAMLAPPIAGYFLLRHAGRARWGALGGAILLFFVTLLAIVFVALAAVNHGLSLDAAMWLVPVVVGGASIAIWRKW